jgi:hypothetical protein
MAEDGQTDLGFYESRKDQYGRKNYLMAVPKTRSAYVYVWRPNTGRSQFEVCVRSPCFNKLSSTSWRC